MEFLLVQLQLHSPCDVHIKNPAFYASNQKKWLEILKSIYSFCLDTIEDIANKKSNPFNKDLQASDKLILLAAKCTKQVIYQINQLWLKSFKNVIDFENALFRLNRYLIVVKLKSILVPEMKTSHRPRKRGDIRHSTQL